MLTGYCNNCKQNVLMVREEFNICLAVILLIFTAGIGFLIYLAVYYAQEPNKCVHCKTICQPILVSQLPSANQELPNVYHQQQEYNTVKIQETQPVQSKVCYCPSCGTQLGDRPNIKYCAFCGSSVE